MRDVDQPDQPPTEGNCAGKNQNPEGRTSTPRGFARGLDIFLLRPVGGSCVEGSSTPPREPPYVIAARRHRIVRQRDLAIPPRSSNQQRCQQRACRSLQPSEDFDRRMFPQDKEWHKRLSIGGGSQGDFPDTRQVLSKFLDLGRLERALVRIPDADQIRTRGTECAAQQLRVWTRDQQLRTPLERAKLAGELAQPGSTIATLGTEDDETESRRPSHSATNLRGGLMAIMR